jgi:protein-tyrosine phosphatase
VGVRTAARLGLNLSGHVSREVSPADMANADLVLTMTREQARQLVVLDPAVWPRVFLLTEFVAWLDQHPRPDGTPLATWIRQGEATRSRSELVGTAGSGEIPDPLGRPPRAWRAVASLLRDNLSGIFARIEGGAAATTSTS